MNHTFLLLAKWTTWITTYLTSKLGIVDCTKSTFTNLICNAEVIGRSCKFFIWELNRFVNSNACKSWRHTIPGTSRIRCFDRSASNSKSRKDKKLANSCAHTQIRQNALANHQKEIFIYIYIYLLVFRTIVKLNTGPNKAKSSQWSELLGDR